MNKSNIIITTSVVLVTILIIGIYVFSSKNTAPVTKEQEAPISTKEESKTSTLNKDNSYVYSGYGFDIFLPKDFTPKITKAEDGHSTIISLPTGSLSYIPDASYWEKYNIPNFTFVQDKMIGETVFKLYSYGKVNFYWLKKENAGYAIAGTDSSEMENILKTFKYTGIIKP